MHQGEGITMSIDCEGKMRWEVFVVTQQVTDMAHVEVRTPKTTNTEIILVETSYVKRI